METFFSNTTGKNISKKNYLNYLLFVCLEIIDHLPSLSSLMNELLVARLCSAHLRIFMPFENNNFFSFR